MLSTDLGSDDSIPYFLWDEPMTVAEFGSRLQTASTAERIRLLAKLLREARDTDVWLFTTPSQVWTEWPGIAPKLGRRRAFWEFLLGCWNKEGLMANHQGVAQLPDRSDLPPGAPVLPVKTTHMAWRTGRR